MPERMGGPQVANEATHVTPVPGQGGWTPGQWVPALVAVMSGGGVAVGALLTAGGPVSWLAVLGAIVGGMSSGAAAYFGIKSAGPRVGQ